MGLYANPSRTELREVRESAGAVGYIYIVRGQWAAGDRRERRGRRRASKGGPRSRARLAHENLRGVVRSELVVDGILPRRCCPAPASCWIGWMVEQEEVGIGGDCLDEGGTQDAVRGTAARVAVRFLLLAAAALCSFAVLRLYLEWLCCPGLEKAKLLLLLQADRRSMSLASKMEHILGSWGLCDL
jgi:hypothetical protein